MNNGLTWKELKALNDIYENGKSYAKIQSHPYIKYLFHEKGYLDNSFGNTKVLVSTEKYNLFYENNLKENYTHYKDFLTRKGITPDGNKTFSEEDIKTFMLIDENRDELKNNLTTIEVFSSEIFDYVGSKYLKNRPSIKKAVCQILGIEDFPANGADHQWRLVVDCKNPIYTVLCENKAFLKQPWIAKENNIKLWYVGGNNIKIIDDIDEIEFHRPVYYSCDWDLAGLQIYCRIKEKLSLRNKMIQLLYPSNLRTWLPVDSPYHKSKWVQEKQLSGLNLDYFNKNEVMLIRDLIRQSKWIEEESNNLLEMVYSAINS